MFGTAWPAAALYGHYRSAFTKDRYKGLDSDEKMAAIGYMAHGTEGAQWGYLLGSLVDKKKLHRRSERMSANLRGGVMVGTIVFIWAEVGTASLLEGLKDYIDVGKLGGTVDGLGGFNIDSQLAKYFETNDVHKFTLMACGLAAFTHINKNQESNPNIDTACLFGANL